MRAYIGPYPSRAVCDIFNKWLTFRYKKVYWEVEDTEYTKLDKFVDSIERGVQFVYNHSINPILDRRSRKIKVKLDKYDTWDAHTTIAHIALPLLIQLKKGKHGAPNTEDEDVPEELRSTSAPEKQHEYDVDDNHFKRYDWILGEMIFAMQSVIDDTWEDKYHSGDMDFTFEKVEDGSGNSQMVEGPNHTHVWDREGYLKEYNRISNGCRLFGKYFRTLWD